MTCQTAVIFGGARWGRTVTFDLESLVGVARESFLCFLLSFDLLTHFIFIKLAVVGTKFCLCSKVTDQLTDYARYCFFFPHLLSQFKQLWKASFQGIRCFKGWGERWVRQILCLSSSLSLIAQGHRWSWNRVRPYWESSNI